MLLKCSRNKINVSKKNKIFLFNSIHLLTKNDSLIIQLFVNLWDRASLFFFLNGYIYFLILISLILILLILLTCRYLKSLCRKVITQKFTLLHEDT